MVPVAAKQMRRRDPTKLFSFHRKKRSVAFSVSATILKGSFSKQYRQKRIVPATVRIIITALRGV
jgi:hypothetical protein